MTSPLRPSVVTKTVPPPPPPPPLLRRSSPWSEHRHPAEAAGSSPPSRRKGSIRHQEGLNWLALLQKQQFFQLLQSWSTIDLFFETGYVFDKECLSQYDHMSFGGAPVEVGTEEEAEELILKNEKDSSNEAAVLSAPPKLVYNRFVLRLAREILEAVVDRWNQHVLVIDKIIPPNWKDEPAARILELCILHLAMAEITAIGTRHQIVINEAVDLTKRFCDGCAPRIINGCLQTFIKNYNAMNTVQS